MGEVRDRWSGVGSLLSGARGERLCAGPAGAAFLVLLCLAVYLPGLRGLPVVDRDEARFAQASRQMLESAALPEAQRDDALHAGGLLVPMLQDRERLVKPPLIYWLQAGSAYALTGADPARDHIWMYRAPSVLAAIVAVLLTWRLGRSMAGARAGLLAAALLAVCPMVVWDANQARADQLLLACTTLAVLGLWHVWRTRERDRAGWLAPALLWTGVGLGILTKGPITPMVVALAAVALGVATGQWRWLGRTRPWPLALVPLAMVAPWVVAVAQRVGWSEYFAVVYDEVIVRSATAKEGHWGPPGYHLVLLAVLFWPGSLLAAAALLRTFRLAIRFPKPDLPTDNGDTGTRKPGRLARLVARWRTRVTGRDAELFLVAWILPSWIVFELVGTKLPHYTLPLYPAIAIATAGTILAAAGGAIDPLSERASRIGVGIWLVIGVALVAAMPVGAAALGGNWLAWTAAGASCAVGIPLLLLARRTLDDGFVVRAHLLAIGASILVAWTLIGAALPRASAVWLTPRLMEAAGDRPVASVRYHEDSLLFATRGRAVRLEAHEAEPWLRRTPGGVVIAPAGTPFDTLDFRTIDEIKGINYAGGRFEVLQLIERAR